MELALFLMVGSTVYTQQTEHLPTVNYISIKVTVTLCFMVKG